MNDDLTPDVDPLYESVFHEAANAMLILDDRCTVLQANRAAAALFGIGADPLRGRSLNSLLTDEDACQAMWAEQLALGEIKREHEIRGDAGTRMVECTYRNVGAGRHLCIAHDITERRILEERLAAAEKLEGIGRLAGGVAHDFNNLLTAILGYTELLLENRSADDADRLDLEEIHKAGQRAAGLTQQLLAFSRKQVLVPTQIDLNEIVSGLQPMLRRLIREDISLSCDLASAPIVVMIDKTQIEQVILNLVLNARDAQPAGGDIRLELARVPHTRADVPRDVSPGDAGWARLRVIDRGTGIAPEIRAHLFEPFFTTKELGKGTGLGLASVYGIVCQSNGFIGVESEPGRTVFTMHFPALTPGERTAAPAAPATRTAHGTETILLVEDEDPVRVIVATLLRRQGYHVLEAASGRQACDIFERHADEIDLLIADVVMPEMNGPALAQRLIATHPGLRVLFISGYADMTIPLDARNPNMGFLSKPFQATGLAQRVREMLWTHADKTTIPGR